MNLKQLAQILVNIEWSLNQVGNDLLQMDKPYGDQVLKLAKELGEVITELTVAANMHEMTKAGK